MSAATLLDPQTFLALSARAWTWHSSGPRRAVPREVPQRLGMARAPVENLFKVSESGFKVSGSRIEKDSF